MYLLYVPIIVPKKLIVKMYKDLGRLRFQGEIYKVEYWLVYTNTQKIGYAAS